MNKTDDVESKDDAHTPLDSDRDKDARLSIDKKVVCNGNTVVQSVNTYFRRQ